MLDSADGPIHGAPLQLENPLVAEIVGAASRRILTVHKRW
jgi:hypothetical protein